MRQNVTFFEGMIEWYDLSRVKTYLQFLIDLLNHKQKNCVSMWEIFEIPTFGIPTFIIPIEKYSHNTNAPIIIPMPLSKYQCPIQNTHDARSKYQLNVRNTNKLKRVQFINSKYQQVGILNTVHNTNPSPQNNHLGACCCWAATSSRLAG